MPIKEMKKMLELWPGVQKSQVRTAVTPQGEKKGKGCSLKPLAGPDFKVKAGPLDLQSKNMDLLQVTDRSGVDAGRHSVT